MSSFDMPTKRTYAPTPQGLAKVTIRLVVCSILAGMMLIGGHLAWNYAWSYWPSRQTSPAEVQAATPSPAVAQPKARGPAPVDPKTDIVEEAAALQERLAVSICEGYGLIFDGPERGCVRPPPPKAWSKEGIRERGAQGHPLQEAGEFIKKFSTGLIGPREQAQEDELTPRARVASDSESWRPRLRLQGYLHEPGEPCPGGGHRDEAGLMCKFTDEERAELRERRGRY